MKEISDNYELLVGKFNEAKAVAGYHEPLHVLGPQISPEGQPWIPVRDVKPWANTEQMLEVKIKKAQHLMDGGLFRYKGCLQDLEDTEKVNEEISRVQQIIFTDGLRAEKGLASNFSKINSTLTKKYKGEALLS